MLCRKARCILRTIKQELLVVLLSDSGGLGIRKATAIVKTESDRFGKPGFADEGQGIVDKQHELVALVKIVWLQGILQMVASGGP